MVGILATVTTKRAATKDDVRPVVIRMPAELHQAVKEKAAAEERSMAQAIRYALRVYTKTT